MASRQPVIQVNDGIDIGARGASWVSDDGLDAISLVYLAAYVTETGSSSLESIVLSLGALDGLSDEFLRTTRESNVEQGPSVFGILIPLCWSF